MKKVIGILLFLALTAGLTGCDNTRHESSSSAESSQTSTNSDSSSSSSSEETEVIFNEENKFSDENKIGIIAEKGKETGSISVTVMLDFNHKDIKREYCLIGGALLETDKLETPENKIVLVTTGDESGLFGFNFLEKGQTVNHLPSCYNGLDFDDDVLAEIYQAGDEDVIVNLFKDLKNAIGENSSDESSQTETSSTSSDNLSKPQETQPQSSSSAPALTTGEKNALSRAKSYLRSMAFSHDRLISQLKFEGFSDEEAEYAADNVNADWNEQAEKKAKSYIDTMAFSYSGLVKQLEYEKFTHEQAVYGAEQNGY